ncbi:MAG: hypothetical protein M1838_000873 [Thelocarpon superellum]|nr:MAG: hypothetical protein M1838_000873 [Thelocarpon superellum]
MPIPLAIAGPLAAASLAYLNARTSFLNDIHLLHNFIWSNRRRDNLECHGRLNGFYKLERFASDPKTSQKAFLFYQGQTWTYQQTYETVLKYGAWLRTRHGIKPQEIVAMDFMNSQHFVFLWFGLWSIGAVPAFLNYNLTGKPLVHSIKTSSARLFFVDEELRPTFTSDIKEQLSAPSFRQDSGGAVEVVFFSPAVETEILKTEGIRAPDSTRSGVKVLDMAILIYTSGTTGLPKPAIVSWSKTTFGSTFVRNWMRWRKEDIMYTCMPLYHSSAVLVGVMAALNGGSTIAIGRRFSTKTFWKEAREANATIVQYVGETCRYLLAAPPEIDAVTGENLDRKNNVRLAVGNGLRPDIWKQFKERFGIDSIAEFYSATESTSGFFNLSNNDFGKGAIGTNGTLARLVLGKKVAVTEVDWDEEAPVRDRTTGFCRRVSANQPGELLFRVDPQRIKENFQGYYGDEKASNAKILRDVFAKGDVFFRTGDVVRWDHDGRWFFVDRIGDTFRWKSENVSANEVSESLSQHDSIVEANVYGVSIPHHDGRAGTAATVLSVAPTPAVLGSIAQHARATLPAFAVPLFLRVTPALPTTGTNKQQKHQLRVDGIDPVRLNGTEDRLFWLRGSAYVPFTDADWADLNAGKVRL